MAKEEQGGGAQEGVLWGERESPMEGTGEIIYAANTSYQCGLETFYGNMPSPVLYQCGSLEGGEQKAVAGS